MQKFVLGGITAAAMAVGLIAAPSAFANSDTCFNRSLNGERVACTTSTSAEDADEAVISTGRRSIGKWTLTCTDRRGDITREQERIGRAARVVVLLDGRQECVLRATVASRKRAVARVALNETEDGGHGGWPWDKPHND